MKREKRQTKKERKAANPSPPPRRAAPRQQQQEHGHIHCIACGKHLDVSMFGEPDGADFIRCDHGSDFPSCVGCMNQARELVAEHDRSGSAVQVAPRWH